MHPFSPLILIWNSVTLALSLGFLLIILWYDIRRELNQFFATLLILTSVWNVGSLLQQLGLFIELDAIWLDVIQGFIQVGFVGSSVAIYVFVTALAGVHPRRFRLLAFAGLFIAIAYNVLVLSSSTAVVDVAQTQSISAFFFLLFDTIVLFIIWRYRRKIRSVGLLLGVMLFVLGQGLSFFNPNLGVAAIATTVSLSGMLVLSFAYLQRELITPLANRNSQLETMHEVSLAITRRIATDTVLDEIARQAVNWLEADAAGIFLLQDDHLQLVRMVNLPERLLGTRLQIGQGVVGMVVAQRKSIYLENYSRDWHGEPDLPYAAETFGSVVCAPFIAEEQVIGVLMVIAGLQGRLFDKDDVRLLELLCGQTTVVLSHGQLFQQLELAHNQLKTVLEGTENPVVAVDRHWRLIFVNAAAIKNFGLSQAMTGQRIVDVVPAHVLPSSYKGLVRELRRQQAFVYEVAWQDKVYLCNVARLGEHRIEGWVAVLNDVTELKELDRIKGEMVRMTSHDLKNPLQAALANLDLMRDDVQADYHDELELSINNVERQLNRMNRIISGILDLERARTSTKPTEICHPADIAMGAVDEVRDIARDQKITLDLHIQDDLPDFVGDVEHLERAIVNLIENAIKFTRSGGQVVVSVYRDEAGQIVFAIRDTGIGIPPEQHQKIFDRFYRGEQPGAEHISGTGLGLSLVKTVVESHHGKLSLESEMGKGSTFFVTLPPVGERLISS